MKRFRFYTNDLPEIREVVTQRLEAATLMAAVGLWKGAQERSLIVEVIAEDLDPWALAEEIKQVGHQEAVLVTVEELPLATLV